MYNRFFGFKERPFKLVPNPAYVYLSRIHEEALAHLNYAVRYGDGFVSVTGEVGTGKTTLCRMFLENLDENTEIAYIFNPKLDALQLLKAINDEFYIPSDTDDSLKGLIDSFNAFLLEKKAQDRRVILLVDEAQNLSADVLEQLRLLSNLETNTSKLLQIILVGQPELSALLDTDRLRQLKQRITLNCHLTPLNEEETQEYVRHRLHIAATKPGVTFSTAACRAVFKHSNGVPRLINIVCDRALLIAFTLGKQRIDGNIVKRAIRELQGKKARERSTPEWGKWTTGLIVGIAVSVTLLTLFQLHSKPHKIDPVISAPATLHETAKTAYLARPHASVEAVQPTLTQKTDISPVPPLKVPEPPIVAEIVEEQAAPVEPIAPDLQKTILSMEDHLLSRRKALEAVLNAWDATVSREEILPMDVLDNSAYFRATARLAGLKALRIKGRLNDLRKLDLPAILEISRPEIGDSGFLAILALADDDIVLSNNDSSFATHSNELTALWNGVAHILWKDVYHFEGMIPTSSPAEAIIALKMHLKTLGFPITRINTTYDPATRRAIKSVQAHHGLTADGMVGPLTKIVLYNEDSSLAIPHLRKTGF